MRRAAGLPPPQANSAREVTELGFPPFLGTEAVSSQGASFLGSSMVLLFECVHLPDSKQRQI